MNRALAGIALWALSPALAFAAKNLIVSDPYYFRDAPKAVLSDLEGVLTILVDHEGKPSKGLRRLVVYPKPDAAATPVLDCAKLEPRLLAEDPADVPRRRPEELRPMQVCGMRLMGRTLDAPVDRIQLAVTGTQGEEPEIWYEVVRDPDENERGWVRLETRRQSVLATPVMEYRTLDDWIGSGGGLRLRPYRSFGGLVLRTAPYAGAPLAPGSATAPSLDVLSTRRIVKLPPLERPDARLRYLGIQGAWVRVEVVAPSCRSEESGEGAGDAAPSAPACPAGWVPWRDPSGEPRLFPETWRAP